MLLIGCVTGTAACSGCSETSPPVVSKEPDPSVSRAKGAIARTATSGRFAPLRQRLAEEASHRIEVPLKTDEVFAALEKDGIMLERKRQQTASPHFASYCMSARTGVKVHVTVCEHESEERAEENVKAIQRVERPERKIVKNGQTTLLTRRDLNDDSETPLVEKVIRVFEQMNGADQ